ncbi:MAG: hypothetical protein E7526_00800 [Ruminococcaceae bacterium]|nr:hypothetical protein [Oscillospiraceae bacterium]
MAVDVLGALKLVGSWLAEHPGVVLNFADQAKKLIPTKEEKFNVLSAAVLEVEQKTNEELAALRKQIHTMKIILSVMGVALGATIIAIILLAIFR